MTSKVFDLVLGLIVDVAFSFTNFRPGLATRFPEFRSRIRRRLPTFESGLNSSKARCPSRPSPGGGSSPRSEELIKLHNTVKLGFKELIGIGQIFTLWPGFLISRKVKALNEYDQTNRLLLFVCYHQKSILTEFVVIKLLIILFSDSNFCASNLTIFFLLT